jgi:hypothetical protein
VDRRPPAERHADTKPRASRLSRWQDADTWMIGERNRPREVMILSQVLAYNQTAVVEMRLRDLIYCLR